MAVPPQLRMPEHLVARAHSVISGDSTDWEAPPLRDAATVVMVRDTSTGMQVYLQRRVRTMAFAAGMYVFPGGAVDTADLSNAAQVIEGQPEQFDGSDLARVGAAALGYDTLAARFAAIREVIEETSHTFDDPMGLTYIAHWVTPAVEARRYDTRFYAARLSEDHSVIENSGESDAHRWVRPQAALDEYGAGAMAMLPPTVAVLAAFAAAAQAGNDAAAAIAELGSATVQPLLPSPFADPASPSGVGWELVDVRTGEVAS